MKRIDYVIMNDGEEISIGNRKVTNVTFYDLQTRGPIAKKNLFRTLKEALVDVKNIKQIVIKEVYIDLY